MTQRPPLVAIALLSLATLAVEILLMRLFSITQWHHFAYMIISLALLGYGASGSFVTLFQRPLERHFSVAFTAAVGLFGITASGAFLLAQQLPFNAEELLWDPLQPWWLLLMYLLLAIPFFFAASAIALALTRFSNEVGKLYAFDLFGAGLGGLFVIGLLFMLMPLAVLGAIGLLSLLATVAAALELRDRKARITAALLAIPILITSGATFHSELQISPYKGLAQTLQVAGSEIVDQQSSPLGLLTAVTNNTIPFRHAPGLSLMASTEPPPQIAIFTDADGMTVITRDDGDAAAFRYLDEVPSALPYHLRKPGSVLILGAGGGADVLQAKYHGAAKITAVELNPQLVELVNNRFGTFSAHLYDQESVELHIDEARGFVSSSTERFDLIQLSLMDAFGASSAGLHALNEHYHYTVEALQTYLDHVSDDGYLSISRWIRLPPRDVLKLFATAVIALREQGIDNPMQQLVLIRNWQIATLLVKNSPFSRAEIEDLKTFAKARAFDLAWYPGMSANEANRFNQLAEPWFYRAAVALGGDEAAAFTLAYKFNLTPATDDRPYYFHFFKWRSLTEIFSLRARGGMALLEQGYLVLVVALVQAAIVSLLLILLPLRYLQRQTEKTIQPRVWRVSIFFFSLGLAFLFIEMSFIQKFILLLHHPLYSVATVMTAFLIFAGAGSWYSQQLTASKSHRQIMAMATAAIILIGSIFLLAFPLLRDGLLTMPFAIRLTMTLITIAPLAFFMGMPFPLGLASLGMNARPMIPWAWGINGCASVISAIIATLMAMHWGFSTVIVSALLLYLLAALTFPGRTT